MVSIRVLMVEVNLYYLTSTLSINEFLSLICIFNSVKKLQLHIKLQNATEIQVQAPANANVQTVMQQIKVCARM